jgi:hypothetical protein
LKPSTFKVGTEVRKDAPPLPRSGFILPKPDLNLNP